MKIDGCRSWERPCNSSPLDFRPRVDRPRKVGLPHYVPVRQGYEVVKVRTKNGAGRTVARTARPIMFYAQTAKNIKISL